MRTKFAEAADLDDLLFENRNKNYGAYALRKTYDERLTAGLGFSVGLFVLLTLLLWLPHLHKPVIPSMPSPDHPTINVVKPFGGIEFTKPKRVFPQASKAVSIKPDLYHLHLTTKTEETLVKENPHTNPEGPTQNTGDNNGSGQGNGGGAFHKPEAPDSVFNTTQILDFPDEFAEFPGGQAAMEKYLRDKIKYPNFAIDNGIQGMIYVQIRVSAKGEISDAMVLKGIGGGCDEEALRVVRNMPRWKPGKFGGKAVPVHHVVRIRMELQ